jgi:hypothetical protein
MPPADDLSRRRLALLLVVSTVGAASQAARVARGEAGALVLVGLAAFLLATTLLAWQLYRQTRRAA